MQIVKFEQEKDLDRLEAYLADRYLENRRAVSWLPERLHDLIYRVGMQEADEGRERSAGHIYLWEDNDGIAACILPDGENIYVSIRDGWEWLFPSMIDFSEKNCRSLFGKAEDGSVKFWFAVDRGLTYMQEALRERIYEVSRGGISQHRLSDGKRRFSGASGGIPPFLRRRLLQRGK